MLQEKLAPPSAMVVAQHEADPLSPSLWSRLPAELLERLVACLPISSLFRFRSVSSHWNSLSSTPHFIHLRSSITLHHPSWLTFTSPRSKDALLAFDFASFSWYRLPLPFLSDTSFVGFSASSGCRFLVSLTSLRLHDMPHLYICNPLMQSLVTLPPLCIIKTLIARGLATNPSGEGYVVMVIGNARKQDLVVEVYRSLCNAWDVHGSLPSDFIIKHDHMIELDGAFYVLLLEPSGILVLSIDGFRWRVQAMPVEIPKFWSRLVVCQRSLLMIGGFEGEHRIDDIRIWKFQPTTSQWQELGSMPHNICQELFDKSCSNWFECVGVGDFVCFRSHGNLKVLMFNLYGNSWTWLPDCMHAFDPMLARGFHLDPQLE